jgi:hypothetical protein
MEGKPERGKGRGRLWPFSARFRRGVFALAAVDGVLDVALALTGRPAERFRVFGRLGGPSATRLAVGRKSSPTRTQVGPSGRSLETRANRINRLTCGIAVDCGFFG